MPPGTPRPALTLGLFGLAPFFATAILALAEDPGLSRLGSIAFAVYAAVILSFLGGVRWGLEIARAPSAPRTDRLVYSVLPSLAGWALAGVVAIQPGAHGAASAFAGLFAAQYVWDQTSARDAAAPAWYPMMRQILTGGVLLACLILPVAGVLGSG